MPHLTLSAAVNGCAAACADLPFFSGQTFVAIHAFELFAIALLPFDHGKLHFETVFRNFCIVVFVEFVSLS